MEQAKKSAYRFITLMGVVSLFGDITYEGARSITGPFLATLGAGAAAVGVVSGFGEFLGYAVRLASGYFADRKKLYWPFTFAGYAMMLSVPFLAFAGKWEVAALFILLERLGKGVRTPARDAILSHAAKRVGMGWGFALHEFFDTLGGIIGPLIFTAVFLSRGNYPEGFKILFIPALLSLFFLARAARMQPHPEKMESAAAPDTARIDRLRRTFWIYCLFTFFNVAGVINFQLISYHLKVAGVVSDAGIPLLYMVSMAVSAVFVLLIGKYYDRTGFRSLLAAPIAGLPITFLLSGKGLAFSLAAVALLGVAIGVQTTIMRAGIGDITEPARRGFAYGVFNTVYGAAFLIGSSIMGLLYSVSMKYVIAFSVIMEACSVAVFVYAGFYRRAGSSKKV